MFALTKRSENKIIDGFNMKIVDIICTEIRNIGMKKY